MASWRCRKAVYTRGLAFEQPLEAEKPLMADYVVPSDAPGSMLELVQ